MFWPTAAILFIYLFISYFLAKMLLILVVLYLVFISVPYLFLHSTSCFLLLAIVSFHTSTFIFLSMCSIYSICNVCVFHHFMTIIIVTQTPTSLRRPTDSYIAGVDSRSGRDPNATTTIIRMTRMLALWRNISAQFGANY